MIKRIRIRNFLSLRDITLELGVNNLVVGANMSGKSNLVDCFRFLTAMVTQGLNKAFLDRGGFHEVAWKGGDESRIYFGLTVETPLESPFGKKEFDYEISILGGQAGTIAVEKEKLTLKTDSGVKTLIDLKSGHGEVRKEDGSVAFTIGGDPTKSALQYDVPGWEGGVLRALVSTWRFYSLIPTVMKQANAASSQIFLDEYGNNFSSWFMTLLTQHPEEFRRIRQTATDVLPSLTEILTPPTQVATTYVMTQEKYLKRPVNIWRMSDGELCFLALLSLVFAPAEFGSPLFCVEEPESHLHPRLIEALTEILSQRQQELGANVAQIVATTHSPCLIDKVKIEDLIVVEKENGESIFTRPASKGHLKELLEKEEVGLGDLWYSGALSH
ncbi:MAG: AAA family ATPase [Candidatus Binatia bacterium]